MRGSGRSITLASLMLQALLGVAYADEAHQRGALDQPAIQIDTSAAVERFPDVAEVKLGVSGDAPDDQGALARNSENLLHLLAVIRNVGVLAKDIEQQRTSVGPLYQVRIEGGQQQLGERVGFRATTYVTLTLRDMPRAGSVIQAAIRAGANIISQIEFQLTSERRAEARAEARASAIAFAERLARQSAQAAGGSGAHLISVEDPPEADYQFDIAGLPPPDPLGTSAQVLIIEPGKIAISEKVRATFRMLP
jgi:uncharacterized protein